MEVNNKIALFTALAIVAALLYQTLKRTVSKVKRCLGKNGQEMVKLLHKSGACCDVYLHGATVTRYATSGGQEVLWLSKTAVFDGKKAIRGGIPVVFPQFGPKADKLLKVDSMSQHGFARNLKWEIKSAEVRMNGECQVVLTLTDSDATRAKYPHHFLLEYVVSLDEKRLLTSLKMTNMDEEGTIAPQALLHTYFSTEKIEDTEVHGLSGTTYFDQLTSDKSMQTGDIVGFVGEMDRIYSEVKEKKIKVGCRGQRGVIELTLECAYQEEFGELGTVPTQINPDVVWNPHIAKSKKMSDFEDDGWKRMCCVEPGILNESRPAITPANSVVLSQAISYIP